MHPFCGEQAAAVAVLLLSLFSTVLANKKSVLINPAPTSAHGAPAACRTLASSGNGNADFVVTAEDPNYETLRTANFAQNAWAKPLCIISPNTAEEVALTLKMIQKYSAPFAVRSGGHSMNYGWSNIDDGVLISLTNFNEVTYDKSSETVVIGTGQRWGAVYAALEKYNVTVVGGRVVTVGVGGYLLGGGLSHLSGRYGLGCDNVVNYEVVLASGAIIDANKDSHSDLFWALKGGTSNFGIVTRFTVSAYPIGAVWGGIITYDINQTTALNDALVDYQLYQNNTLSGLYTQVVMNQGIIFLTLVYQEPVKPVSFSPFYRIPALNDTTGIKSWVEFHNEWDAAPWIRCDFHTVAVDVDRGVYADTMNIARDAANQILDLDIEGADLTIVAQPISENFIDQGRAKGGNTLGLKRKKQMWFDFVMNWVDAADDKTMLSITHNGVTNVTAVAKSKGLSEKYLYLNDAGSEQPVIASYGRENVGKMRSIAKAYDPHGVFETLEPGGFKLPTAGFRT